jgi:hypothetical protein
MERLPLDEPFRDERLLTEDRLPLDLPRDDEADLREPFELPEALRARPETEREDELDREDEPDRDP